MFDPYRKWLGIPKTEQPPHYYRLLGIEPFESDLDVVEAAVDRQMSFIRQYQSGEHAAEAANILNEIAAARVCLLKPSAKQAYDTQLRSKIKTTANAIREPEPTGFPFDVTDTPAAGQFNSNGPTPSKTSNSMPLLLGVGGAVIVVGILAFVLFGGSSKLESKPAPIASTTPVQPSASMDKETTPKGSETVKAQIQDDVKWSDMPLVTIQAGGAIDLLKAIDKKRDVVAGDWEPTRTALIGTQRARIYLPVKPPEDYQLKFSLRRLDGQDFVVIGFPMAGRQGMVVLDGWQAAFSGLYVDGRDPRDNCTTRPGKMFSDQRLAKVVLTVHPGHLNVTFDDKTIIDWHGDPERLYLDSNDGMPSRETPFVALGSSRFVIESASLTPIKPQPEVSRPDRLKQVVDVIPLMDPDRDAVRGIWSITKNGLNSPYGWAKCYLPTVVPREYTISGDFELPDDHQGGYALCIGLVVGPTICQFVATDSGIGLDMIDNSRRFDQNETRMAPVFKPGSRVRFDCTVTAKGIRIDADGKTMIDWQGDLKRLSLPGDWPLPDSRRLYVGSLHHFKIRDLKLGPPIPPHRSVDPPPASVGQPADLLAIIDPDRDSVAGEWERDGKFIRAKGNSHGAKLNVPYQPPSDYKLTVRVAREPGGISNNQAFYVHLPTAGSKAMVAIDGHGSTASGTGVDDADYRRPPATYGATVLPDGQLRELVCYVRGTGIKVTCEGKALYDWTGNLDRLVAEIPTQAPNRKISLVSWDSRFRIEKLDLEPLEPTAFPAVATLGSDGKLIPVLNAQRDSRKGDWKLENNGLTCPAIPYSRLELPIAVPSRYVLTGKVERKQGRQDLLIGLVVGGHPCSVSIDSGDGAGIDLLDGSTIAEPLNLVNRKYSSRVLPVNESIPIRCVVLPDTILVQCGQNEVIRWHGDPRRLSARNSFIPANYSDKDRQHLWLGALGSEFVIRDLELRPLEDTESNELIASFMGAYPTVSQRDVPFQFPFSNSVASTETKTGAAPATPGTGPASNAAADRLKDIKFENAVSGRISAEGKAALLAQMGGNDASEAAVARGLKWLAAHQFADGSWSFDHDAHPDCLGLCKQSGTLRTARTGATGIALLAFFGNGQTHKQGEHQAEMKRGIDFLLKNSKSTPQGLDLCPIVSSNEKMYVQGVCTIALCELAAMTKDARIKTAATQAAGFIAAAQNPKTGGWRYFPYSESTDPGDTSVVGWQVMALKAAKNAKIVFPGATMKGAELFLNAASSGGGSQYTYEMNSTGQATASTTAVGLLCRIHLGWERSNKSLQQGVQYLSAIRPAANNMYFNYYATQVLYHWGGEEWTAWNAEMRDQLVRTQQTDKQQHTLGSWDLADVHGSMGGRLYMTCLSLMTLEVYYRYLPVFRPE